MFYQGLECILTSVGKDLQILLGIKNCPSVVSVIANKKESLDLLILELDRIDLKGIYYVKEIIKVFPNIRILVIVGSLENSRINEMMKTGTKGIVLSNCSISDLRSAIEKVRSGNHFFCGSISRALLEEMEILENRSTASLSEREIQILKLVVAGRSNQEVAKELGISISTAKTHRQNIMRKLDARNLIELLQKVHFHNILPSEEDPFSQGCSLLDDQPIVQTTIP